MAKGQFRKGFVQRTKKGAFVVQFFKLNAGKKIVLKTQLQEKK